MMEFGGFWRRFFALICDSFVAAIPAFLVVAALVKSGFDITGIAVNLATFVVFIGYFVVLQSSTLQTTIGKALLGLKVSTVGGERASALRILGRELAKIVSAIPLYLGFLLAAFTGRKQALHDMIASTVVQKVGPAKPLKGAIVVVVAAVVLGGVTNTLLGTEFEKAMAAAQGGEVAAPKPVAKPVPKPQAVQAKPAPIVAKPAPEAKPAPITTKPAPEVKPAAVAAKPAPAPIAMQVVQAPAPAKPEPAKPMVTEPAKPVVKEEPKPMAAEPPKEEPKPVAATPKPEPMPVQAIPAGPVIPGPKFNDLVTAVLYRDAVAVDELITFGKWPDRPDSRGMTPLMLAAMLGDAPIAEALLRAGANPNHPAPGGHTAMSIARERKDSGMEALLQRHGGR